MGEHEPPDAVPDSLPGDLVRPMARNDAPGMRIDRYDFGVLDCCGSAAATGLARCI